MLKKQQLIYNVLEDTSMIANQLRVLAIPDEVILLVGDLIKQSSQNEFDYLKQVKINKNARVVKIVDLTHNSDLSRLFIMSE